MFKKLWFITHNCFCTFRVEFEIASRSLSSAEKSLKYARGKILPISTMDGALFHYYNWINEFLNLLKLKIYFSTILECIS